MTVVDDYAHHPTEVAATLARGRSAGFSAGVGRSSSPTGYSRTAAFAAEFGDAFDGRGPRRADGRVQRRRGARSRRLGQDACVDAVLGRHPRTRRGLLPAPDGHRRATWPAGRDRVTS